MSPSSIFFLDQTESFVNYYDIFVRHAFGNYKNILKEVGKFRKEYLLLYVEGAFTTVSNDQIPWFQSVLTNGKFRFRVIH